MNCIPSFSTKTIHILNEHIKDPKYKTEMCKNWERFSRCPYNNKCRFAHGKHELMSKEAETNPNYKAKDCLNFFKYGFCSYGRRCCFKHDERKLNEKTIETDIRVLFSLRNPASPQRLSVFEELTMENKPLISKSISSRSTTTCDSSESLRHIKSPLKDKSNSLDSTQEDIVFLETQESEEN